MDDKTLAQVLEQFPTPFYLFDEGELHNRIEHLRALLPARAEICYAMKANSFILEQAARDTDRIEACSPGEVRTCQALGVPDEKIVVSGVYKDPAFIHQLVAEHPGIARYTAESPAQFDLLEEAAREAGRAIPVLLRLTGGNQFGMDGTDLKALATRCVDNPVIDLRGIQYFAGTQKTSAKRLGRELAEVDRFIAEVENECGMHIDELEYGPGLPVLYFDEEDEADQKQDELARTLADLLDGMAFQGHLSLELGRSIAASCGTYVTRIVDAKRNAGYNFAIVDGGKHQITYYGNALATKQPPVRLVGGCEDDEPESWNICGALCTTTDLLVKQIDLRGPRIGDVLVFERAGAYCTTEGIALFLSRDLPSVILRDESGMLHLARARVETHPLNTPSAH